MEGGELPGGVKPRSGTKPGAGTNHRALGRVVSGTIIRERGGTGGGGTGQRMGGGEMGESGVMMLKMMIVQYKMTAKLW